MMQSKKPHLKIAVIGRTGAGKTTFINCLVNHMFNVRFEEPRKVVISQQIQVSSQLPGEQPIVAMLNCTFKQFKNKQAEAGGKQSQSQTTKAVVYDLENDLFKLTIIDTPGIGDTRGMQVDQENCSSISAAVGAMSDLNALILVHKALDCRTDVMLKYLYREMQGILPQSCKQNLLIAFTAVQNPTKIDALLALKELGIPTEGNYFTFENNSLIPKSTWLSTVGTDTGYIPKKLKRLIDDMENAWYDSAEEFVRLFQRIKANVPVSSADFIEISIRRKAIDRLVAQHFHKTVELELLVDEIEHRLDECKRVQQRQKENQDFNTVKTRQVRKEREVIRANFNLVTVFPSKVLFCYICRQDCHVPCRLRCTLRDGDMDLAGCQAFGGNESTGTFGRQTCTECKHSVTRHSHSYKRMESYQYRTTQGYYVTEEYTDKDFTKEQIYEHSKKLVQQLKKDIDHFEEKRRKKIGALNYSYRTIAYLQERLKQLAFSADNEFLLEFLDYKRKEAIQDPKLTDKQRKRQLDAIEKSAEEYRFIKKAVAEGKDGLTEDEEYEVEDTLQGLEAELRALSLDYTLDRDESFYS